MRRGRCPSRQRRRRRLAGVTTAPPAACLPWRAWKQPSKSAACASGSGPTLALDGMTFTVQPGQVTGFVGPNGAGQVHHDAGDPRPGRRRRRQRADRRPAVPEPAAPAEPRRLAAGRRRPAAEPQRPQPPAVAGPLPGPDRPAGRRGDRAGRPADGGPAEGGRLLAGHAAAAGDRRGAARRPAGADAGRAVQRHGPRGHRVDARVPARRWPARAARCWCPAT